MMQPSDKKFTPLIKKFFSIVNKIIEEMYLKKRSLRSRESKLY
ncbi:hypothetical protein QW060_08705 [Myroides ceti]|uniref:Uncharacterized protein n=1 Tax=Paenimyroides ceti TaxID=395087 RepID=A0ABT8CUA1_9FLAO|nr:hypothetical protein [Paenimyroides ceti]MDN3707213.1 hypothetical protein [Paenimyroides ceti]